MEEKEKIRFTARIPKYQHEWLKNMSNITKGTEEFISMNEHISRALKNYIKNY